MKNFVAAIQFLTIFHFKKGDSTEELIAGKAFFPLVGAFLGLILIALNVIGAKFLPGQVLNLFLVTVLFILTGGLHLDGLADFFDALASAKPKDQMLAIMKDCHKGTFGVLAIVLLVLFKIELLSAIGQPLKNIALFLIALLSRYSLNVAIAFFPYARQDGKAKVFFDDDRKGLSFAAATLLVVFLSFLTFKFFSFVILLMAVIFTIGIAKLAQKAVGGITGDVLGAICELNELFVLFMIIIFKGLI